jgi:GNAT superfamily N-acetyltransferase
VASLVDDTMDTTRIVPIEQRHSIDAGTLVKRILSDEYSTAATVCADSDLDEMYAAYCSPGSAAWVALDTTEHVVGVVAVKETPSGALELRRFYVDSTMRGSGLAQELISVAHVWAETESYQQIVLTTSEPMTRAQAFYRRHGYDKTGESEAGVDLRLHTYTRTSHLRESGSTVCPEPPSVTGNGEISVTIERPRRLVEGWHERVDGCIELTEYYPEPVPVNYGYAPRYLNPVDGDSLDVIVLDDRRMEVGESLVCRPVGVVRKPDGDDKLIVVPSPHAVWPVDFDTKEFRGRVEGWAPWSQQTIIWEGSAEAARLLNRCAR